MTDLQIGKLNFSEKLTNDDFIAVSVELAKDLEMKAGHGITFISKIKINDRIYLKKDDAIALINHLNKCFDL